MINTLQEAQTWIEQHSKPRVDKNNFEKISLKNNLLELDSKVISVAGTNGKGSTAACIEAILLCSGYRVATYASPHLISINERCKFNGAPIEQSKFLQVFNEVLAEYEGRQINGFEFLTLVFLFLCKNQSLDYIIVEIGIGGRNCISNLIEPDISVITTIDLDHVEILGGTREAIGYEKSGIFRAGKLAICGDPNPPNTVIDYSSSIGSNLLIQNENFSFFSFENGWEWQSQHMSLTGLPRPNIPLQNASTALAALQFCQVPNAAYYKGLAELSVPGRMQVMQQQPQVICDVAHNPQAVAYLSQQLGMEAFAHTYAVLTMKSSKDFATALQPMLSLIDHWIIYSLPGEELFIENAAQFFTEQHINFTIAGSAVGSLKKARAIATEDDRIIVFGSFQLVGAVLEQYAKN